ncbi:MAG: 23S rRNA (pseudouridine(1915)-N(3))-methyltransferase RlmH [Clostridiales bacterium]|nr:23S rRNA (pseudouridine(1915)-N(3))-methyltransferase RlmH [Clostridiales bacterium]
MLSIRILALGKIKELYLKQGLAEYSKRLSNMIRLSVVELPDEKLPEHLYPAEIERIQNIEGQRLWQSARADEYVIALDIAGEQYSSEKLADKLSQLSLKGQSSLCFMIGASLGLSSVTLRQADLRLSFGAFTYPHQLMRLILLEQIYRACKINKGEPYHK